MTCPDCQHPRVTLIDGTETCSWSEAWRAETEARMVCKMRSLAERRDYLEYAKRKRGERSYAALRDLVARVWKTRPAGGGT
jgi:hypothetical protein